ncbi:MAG TPA: universal stress protein [Candidatus Binatia bacterium]|jgi:nucleotide-binding universal stress UspA family protein|nr:universal stress protein [Candidatus Binatia bacterium]
MSRLRRIVVGYTFAPDGELALRSALALAERAHAALYLLHVVEPYPVYIKMRFPSVPAEALLEEVVLKTRTQLKDLAENVQRSDVRVEADVRVGKPFVELISTCRNWQGALIVVGATKQGEERFLGSTGERVLRKALVPVLVAKRELSVGPKTILVPIDFSPCAQQAAEEALALVRGFGGRIVFLHVLDIRYIYPAAYGAETVLLPVTAEDLEPDWQEFLHDLPLGGLLWEKQTREGHAAQMIAETADEIAADLVVIGTHGRSGLAHMLLGSVAEQVLRSTACSVLTVRPSAFRFELP